MSGIISAEIGFFRLCVDVVLVYVVTNWSCLN
ncbi:MAG: hypothetical protein CMIDDMOC_00784 [Sodalis sp. Fle]|nr:MAG: hypothetical protein CMIDDMOC_00784 [Sodalis sp. Fle]